MSSAEAETCLAAESEVETDLAAGIFVKAAFLGGVSHKPSISKVCHVIIDFRVLAVLF